jgi:hypothetical protein
MRLKLELHDENGNVLYQQEPVKVPLGGSVRYGPVNLHATLGSVDVSNVMRGAFVVVRLIEEED